MSRILSWYGQPTNPSPSIPPPGSGGDGGSGGGSVPEYPPASRTVNVANASQLSSALANAQPGDHIVLANGTYSGTFTASVAGTSAAPIVVRAANKLGATISGIFQIPVDYQIIWGLTFSPGSFISNWTGNFCKLLRCRFDGGIQADDASTISLKGSDCTIAYCEFMNHQTRGITVEVGAGARRALIQRNWFHDVIESSVRYTAALRIGVNYPNDSIVANCIVEYNLFERYHNARAAETAAFKSSGNIARFNTFISCKASGFQNRIGFGNVISGNWVEDSSGAVGGIRVMDRDNMLLGNRLVGSSLRFEVFAGNRTPYEDPNSYSPIAQYPAAWNTILAGNVGQLIVGHYYGSANPPMTVNAKGTVIEAHSGSVVYSRQENTTVSPSTSRQIPSAVKLTTSDVGPFAA